MPRAKSIMRQELTFFEGRHSMVIGWVDVWDDETISITLKQGGTVYVASLRVWAWSMLQDSLVTRN